MRLRLELGYVFFFLFFFFLILLMIFTWPRAGDYEAARRSRNTMGYQIRLDVDNES